MTRFRITERPEKNNTEGSLDVDEGYIKLFRSMNKWEWYSDVNTKAVFLHLLLNANLEESRFRNHVVPKGSLVIGRKSLSETLGISEQSVRTALNHLKTTNEITIKSTNKFSIVTVVNWEKYQVFEKRLTNKSTNKLTNNQPTTNQQLTSNQPHLKKERNKEGKKERIDIYSVSTKSLGIFSSCGSWLQKQEYSTITRRSR